MPSRSKKRQIELASLLKSSSDIYTFAHDLLRLGNEWSEELHPPHKISQVDLLAAFAHLLLA